jgi:hypothetical protein
MPDNHDDGPHIPRPREPLDDKLPPEPDYVSPPPGGSGGAHKSGGGCPIVLLRPVVVVSMLYLLYRMSRRNSV